MTPKNIRRRASSSPGANEGGTPVKVCDRLATMRLALVLDEEDSRRSIGELASAARPFFLRTV